MKANDLIRSLKMQAHPEGGYFAEVYRSSEGIEKSALPSRFSGDRCFATHIYFLLEKGQKSHLHRIQSDEIWHFYAGDPMTLIQITPEKGVEEIVLGSDLLKGESFFHVVPAGAWFGGFSQGEFTLIGATVAPGFDFQDFELGEKEKLMKELPKSAHAVIETLALK